MCSPGRASAGTSVTIKGPVSGLSSAMTSSEATLSDLWIMLRILRFTSSGTGSDAVLDEV